MGICSATRRLNPTLAASGVACALAIALAGLAPVSGYAGEPRREIVFIDDFIRDPALRSDDWAVNGPAVASTLTSLPGAKGASLAPATMSFDSRRGLSLSANAEPGGQQSGIQTQYAYTPPFRLTAVGTAASVGPGALEIALATADAGAGVGMVGGQGVAPGVTGLAMIVAAGPGKPWRLAQDQGLSRDALTAGKPYEFIIDIDQDGLAHVYVRSAGQVLGAEQVQVGSGPFYVVLGQASWAGASAGGQPNLAQWKGVTISRSPR